MDVTAAVRGVRAENLGRASREEFGRVWALAERIEQESADARRAEDFYVIGVMRTCRWLARHEQFHTPVTRRLEGPTPETIGPEYLAALCATQHGLEPHHRPDGVYSEIARGAADVLGWIWAGGAPPQLAPLADTG